MARWLGCALQVFIVVGVVYTVAWYVGPDCCDIYLPPRGPCGGGLQKAKLKRTVADIRIAGAALTAWRFTAGPASPVAPRESAPSHVDVGTLRRVQVDELTSLLVPAFIQQVPEVDGWKHQYEYYFGGDLVLIRSPGCTGSFRDTVYEAGPFLPTDYDQDIVWANGSFVRWPQRF